MDERPDTDAIARRVLVAPTPLELGALAFGVALVAAVFPDMSNSGVDWGIFAAAADGEYVTGGDLAWYYPYWWLWPIEALAALGDTAGYVTLGILNLVGVFFAARVFGTNPALALVAYHTLMASFTGTITGVLAGIVAGLWWALHRRRMVVAGILAAFALAKAGWGIPLVAAMFLLSPTTWRDRLRAVPAAGGVGVVSLAVHGWWPGEVLDRIDEFPPLGNGSLWHFVGPVVLVLWIPVLAVPMDHRTRLTAVAATAMLAAPYLQQYDFTVLFTLAHPWIGLTTWLRPVLVDAGGTEFARAALTAVPGAYYVAVFGRLRRQRTPINEPFPSHS